MTRRALLAGGGAAVLLAGCGEQKQVVVPAVEILRRQLDAEQAVTTAYAGMRKGTTPTFADRAQLARLAARAAAREKLVRTAYEEGGGKVTPGVSITRQPRLEDVLRAEQAALRRQVAGVGLTTDRTLRDLLAGLVAGTATNAAALMALISPQPDLVAFPGEPA